MGVLRVECCTCHAAHVATTTCLGNDFIAEASAESQTKISATLRNHFETKRLAIIGELARTTKASFSNARFAGTDTNAVSCGRRGADEPVDEAQRHCGCALSLVCWAIWHLIDLTCSTLSRTSMREAAHATRETVAPARRVVR